MRRIRGDGPLPDRNPNQAIGGCNQKLFVRFSRFHAPGQKISAGISTNHAIEIAALLRTQRFHSVYSCGAGSWHSGSYNCGSQNDEGRRDKHKRARLMDLGHVFGDYA